MIRGIWIPVRAIHLLEESRWLFEGRLRTHPDEAGRRGNGRGQHQPLARVWESMGRFELWRCQKKRLGDPRIPRAPMRFARGISHRFGAECLEVLMVKRSPAQSYGEVPMNIDQLLELFDLDRGFTKNQLDQSYKDLIQIWHPDKYAYNPRLQQKAEEKLKEINAAYRSLQEFLSRSGLAFDRNAASAESAHLRTCHMHHDPNKPYENKTAHTYDAHHADGQGLPSIPLTSVFHPTDFSAASEVAFSHALKLAMMAHAKLSLLHVTPSTDDVDFADFPEVRHTLERWGTVSPGSSKADAFEKTGVFVEKVVAVHTDPVVSILDFLRRHPRDLIVLATQQLKEPLRWIKQVIAEPIARQSGEITLFIPQGVEGFISHRDGTVRLQRILIPVDQHPSPQRALDAAATLAHLLGCTNCQLTLVHMGTPQSMPVVDTPIREGWRWEAVIRHGDVVKGILELARERSTDLIVMTTQGHDGFLDALRGSTTERILRGAQCPLLAIPARGG
jgi:nucleotide-binding universal stress UspA family protein/DnaJ-domain-containing protein 1